MECDPQNWPVTVRVLTESTLFYGSKFHNHISKKTLLILLVQSVLKPFVWEMNGLKPFHLLLWNTINLWLTCCHQTKSHRHGQNKKPKHVLWTISDVLWKQKVLPTNHAHAIGEEKLFVVQFHIIIWEKPYTCTLHTTTLSRDYDNRTLTAIYAMYAS